MVHHSPRIFEPPPDTKHHWEVILEVAARLNGVSLGDLDDLMVGGVLATFLGQPGSPCEHLTPAEARKQISDRRGPERLLDAMLRAGPYGDGFVDAAEGLSLEKLRKTRHAVDLGPLEPRLPHILRTPGRRIELAPKLLADGVERLRSALREGTREPGMVLIGRRQLQNMNTWLHNLRVLTKGKARCTLLVHPEDATRLRLQDGHMARVRSRVGEVVAPVVVTDEMMPGVVSLPHGFGHDATGARLSVAQQEQPGVNANALADEMVLDELSGTSVLNGIPVEVYPAEPNP